MAPELFTSSSYQSFVSPACDIFALGATLYCMLVGNPPWSGANQLLLAGNLTNFEVTFPPEIEPVNPHLKHLLMRMLEKDPAERISLSDVICHDWVTLEGSQHLFVNESIHDDTITDNAL
jgi:serine/threonine protein kinase